MHPYLNTSKEIKRRNQKKRFFLKDISNKFYFLLEAKQQSIVHQNMFSAKCIHFTPICFQAEIFCTQTYPHFSLIIPFPSGILESSINELRHTDMDLSPLRRKKELCENKMAAKFIKEEVNAINKLNFWMRNSLGFKGLHCQFDIFDNVHKLFINIRQREDALKVILSSHYLVSQNTQQI